MSGFLFQQYIFGPVQSRRLGRSLGVNLLPVSSKLCNFNCNYCECGWTPPPPRKTKYNFPSREEIQRGLEEKLLMFKKDGKDFDAITFAGNGEPTLHPDFNEIISDTIALRNKHFSHVKVAVLSNATTCHKPKIAAALQKVDLNILKLDAGTAKTFETINCPAGNFTFQKLIHNLKLFKEKMIIQSLFLKGKKGGEVFDNTTNEEVGSWLGLLHDLQPTRVMIYSIARGTPLDKIEQISLTKLQEIAAKVTELGLKAEVY